MVKNGSSLLRAGEREGEGEEDSSAWYVFVSMWHFIGRFDEESFSFYINPLSRLYPTVQTHPTHLLAIPENCLGFCACFYIN